MSKYRLTYATLEEDGSPSITVSYDIEARNDRWAMQIGNDLVTEEPGNNAWSIVSIELLPDTTGEEPTT